jgi:hypothetical protein
MAKLVDALSSGGSIRKVVLVRIQFWALSKTSEFGGFSFDLATEYNSFVNRSHKL